MKLTRAYSVVQADIDYKNWLSEDRKPGKFDQMSAELTTTPYCYFDGKYFRYFNKIADVIREAKGRTVWVLKRETGEWLKVPRDVIETESDW